MRITLTNAQVKLNPEVIRASMQRSLSKGVYAAASVYAAGIKTSMKGKAPSPPGTPPAVRTNRLRSSIVVARVPGNDLAAKVGTNVVYARMQEYGGTIRPTRSRMLKIPIGKSVRATGTHRESTVPLRLMVTKRGAFLVADRIRKQKKQTLLIGTDILYVLKASVRIPARPFIRPAMQSASLYTKAAQALMRITRNNFKAEFAAYLEKT
jgi:phage gpG-like protein